MKLCTKCNETKELSEFNKHQGNDDGLQIWCRSCLNEYNRSTNPERMYVNGKYIPKSHPLWKPGRYPSWDAVCSGQEIEEKTKFGHVYIIVNPAWRDWYKVGRALDAYDRLRNYQTSDPHRAYDVIYHEHFDNRKEAEEAVHERLQQHPRLVDLKGEWFKIEPSVIRKVIQDVKREEINSGH